MLASSFTNSTRQLIIDRTLVQILTTRDVLITDYIGVGGVGAAFVNAGLLTLIACAIGVVA